MGNGEIVESEVTGHNKGGLLVDFGRLTGFVPNSQVPQLRSCLGDHQEMARQKGQMIGSELLLNVIDVSPKGKRLVRHKLWLPPAPSCSIPDSCPIWLTQTA